MKVCPKVLKYLLKIIYAVTYICKYVQTMMNKTNILSDNLFKLKSKVVGSQFRKFINLFIGRINIYNFTYVNINFPYCTRILYLNIIIGTISLM